MAFFTYLLSVEDQYPGKTLTFLPDGTVQQISPAKVSMVYAETYPFNSFDEMCDQLARLSDDKRGFLVRGDISPEYIGTKKAFRRKLGKMGDGSVLWRYDPQWICLDIDGMPKPDHLDPLVDPEETIAYVISTLPPYFQDVSCYWQFSSSQSLPGSRDVIKCHLFYYLTNPIPEKKLKEWAKSNQQKHYIDPSVMSSNQPVFIAPPAVRGGKDPMVARAGTYIGAVDILDLNLFVTRIFDRESRVIPIDQKKILGRYLHQLGDGEGKAGFNEVIKSAIGAVLGKAGASVDREQLKRDIREAIAKAPVSDVRTGRKPEEYAEDTYLDPLIDALTIREGESRKNAYNQYDVCRTRYVYITNINRFYDTVSGNYITKDALNMALAKVGRSMAEMFVNDHDFLIVDQLTYFPGRERMCTEESIDTGEPTLCFNLYLPPRVIDEVAVNAALFVEHVRNLAGDDRVFHHMMDWMAYNVQNPGRKIMYSMLIQGKQGTGKSALLEAMKRCMGEQNVRAIETHELLGNFTSWAKGKAMVCVEEIRDSTDRFGIYNRLKPIITAPTLTLNEKNVPAITMRNRMNIMAFTNYETAVPMDDDDRRFFIHFSPMEPRGEEYYNQLFDVIDNHSGAIRRAMLEWDTSHFNPNARAPMTESKEFLIDNAGSPISRLLKEAYEYQQWPLKYDVIVVRDIVEALQGRIKTSESQVAVMLRSLGCKSLGQRRVGEGRRNCWAVRDVPKWELASDDVLTAEYKKPLIDPFSKKEGYIGDDVGLNANF